MTRQDSRHTNPEKGMDAEWTYSSEIGTVKMEGHVTKIPDERLPKKILCGETANRKTLPCWSGEVLQGHPQPPLKTSTYQQSRGNRLHRIEQSSEAS